MLLLYFCIFMAGATLSSAVNCAVYRMNRGLDWVHGHSICEVCHRKLHWWELIPVFSALILRGRCSTCYSKFGYKHSLCEAVCGMLLLLLVLHVNMFTTLEYFLCVLILVVVIVCLAELLDMDRN